MIIEEVDSVYNPKGDSCGNIDGYGNGYGFGSGQGFFDGDGVGYGYEDKYIN